MYQMLWTLRAEGFCINVMKNLKLNDQNKNKLKTKEAEHKLLKGAKTKMYQKSCWELKAAEGKRLKVAKS